MLMHDCTLPTQGEMISRETIRGIVDRIVARFDPQKIVLFGSHAREQASPESDLDLLVIMPSGLPRYKRALPIRMLFRPAPCPMDIVVYTPEEVEHWLGTVNHILTEIWQNGVVLHERA